MTETLFDHLELVWGSIDTICSPLSDEQWALPTDCPGWSIKDQSAHISGSEAMNTLFYILHR